MGQIIELLHQTLPTTSGGCRRLGIQSCVRPHDDAHKGTKILFKTKSQL